MVISPLPPDPRVSLYHKSIFNGYPYRVYSGPWNPRNKEEKSLKLKGFPVRHWLAGGKVIRVGIAGKSRDVMVA
jgi:hypothetical protein